jgi:hypothetical protein
MAFAFPLSGYDNL